MILLLQEVVVTLRAVTNSNVLFKSMPFDAYSANQEKEGAAGVDDKDKRSEGRYIARVWKIFQKSLKKKKKEKKFNQGLVALAPRTPSRAAWYGIRTPCGSTWVTREPVRCLVGVGTDMVS